MFSLFQLLLRFYFIAASIKKTKNNWKLRIFTLSSWAPSICFVQCVSNASSTWSLSLSSAALPLSFNNNTLWTESLEPSGSFPLLLRPFKFSAAPTEMSSPSLWPPVGPWQSSFVFWSFLPVQQHFSSFEAWATLAFFFFKVCISLLFFSPSLLLQVPVLGIFQCFCDEIFLAEFLFSAHVILFFGGFILFRFFLHFHFSPWRWMCCIFIGFKGALMIHWPCLLFILHSCIKHNNMKHMAEDVHVYILLPVHHISYPVFEWEKK